MVGLPGTNEGESEGTTIPGAKFFLDDASKLWVARGGSVDLFAVFESGLRYHVLRIPPGEPMFGIQDGVGPIRMLACPDPEAVIHSSAMPGILDPLLVSSWMAKLASAAGHQLATLEALDHAGLQEFHRRILGLLEERIANREQAHRERLRVKTESGTDGLKSAWSELTAAIGGKAFPSPAGDFDQGRCLARAWEAISSNLGVCAQGQAAVCLPSQPDQAIEALTRTAPLRARKVVLRGSWWTQDAGSILAFRNGHAIALIPGARRSYRLFDPSTGRAVRLNGRLAAELDEEAYAVYRRFPVGPVTLYGLLAFWLRECRSDMGLIALTGLLTGALGLAVPLAVGRLLNFVIPAAQRQEVPVLGGLLLVAALAGALFSYASALALQRAGFRAGSATLYALWDRLLALPVFHLNAYTAGDLAQRTSAIDQIRQIVTQPLFVGALACPFSLIQVVLLFHYRPDLAAPALLLPLSLVAVSIVGSFLLARQYSARAACQSELSSHIFQVISGIAKLRVAGAESRAFRSWARRFQRHRTASIRIRRTTALIGGLQAAAPLAGWTFIVFGSRLKVGAARGGIGDLLVFSVAFQQIIGAAVQFGSLLTGFVQLTPLVDRLSPLLNTAPEFSPSKADAGTLSGAIELENVVFQYQPAHPLLKGVSFKIQPGEFVAIVGNSGCGKSTILRLLLGFEQPDSGRILYDGKDVTTLDLLSLRRQMGVVLQNGRIFDGDIASNILGASTLGLDAAWEAARLAGLDTEIDAMPMKMRTYLTAGGGLSGGQRQRLLIARALIHRPRILLFDEATSALDNRSQMTVSHQIESLKVTRLVIAHRLSTLRNADRILVLNDGVIAESGTYRNLMEQRGCFYHMHIGCSVSDMSRH
jgi:NHLM bacteriocin system ABC transporter ATP-binding protein